MNIVSFGGGSNSTAMLIGMYERGIPVDLILFADTGSEMKHTYDFIPVMDNWLKSHGMPGITVVEYYCKNGERMTLEQECLKSKTLPSIAYRGFKRCSIKHKISTQDKYCNNYEPCKSIWGQGAKVNKYIGYDAGEETRIFNAKAIDISDKKYTRIYPLYEWGWYREDCLQKIQEHGLPSPGKSSCFFCPNMKKHEIRGLRKNNPDLFDRAIAIERNAKPNLVTIKGLGGNWTWEEYIDSVEGNIPQISFCSIYEESSMPCGCYDG